MRPDTRVGAAALSARRARRSRLEWAHRAGLVAWGWIVPRVLGAVAVLATGAVHLHQYYGPYQAIPTIGTLFVVNFVAATVIGVALLAPLEHVAGRWAGAVLALATAGGIALAAGSFVLLTISERTPLWGFQEPGYDPAAISFSRQTEVVAAISLGVSLLARFATRGPKLRW
jgi:hypothetical protein